jgi:hypothetical protein
LTAKSQPFGLQFGVRLSVSTKVLQFGSHLSSWLIEIYKFDGQKHTIWQTNTLAKDMLR